MRFTRSLIVAALVALVVVPAALALRFTDDSYNLPVGTVGQAYTHWFRGDGGCGPALPYQFMILSGSLPPGLSLRKDGLVSGTPTQSGSSSFWVELSDEDPPSASWCRPVTSEREFTIKVDGAAVDVTDRLVIPGLVEAHCHVDKTLFGRPWVPHSAGPALGDRIDNERRRVVHEQRLDFTPQCLVACA